MLGAIYIGLSGLDAYSQGLEEISNNITNLNTAGFKTSIVSFSDMVGTPGRGGLDYSSGGWAGGEGVDANRPQIDFRQGTMQQTGRDLDMAVDGTGFLVLDVVANLVHASLRDHRVGFVVLSLAGLSILGVMIFITLQREYVQRVASTWRARMAGWE